MARSPSVTERAFVLGLTGLVLLFVGLSFTYSATSRRFPLVIGIPTLILLLVLTVIVLFPSLGETIGDLYTNVFNSKSDLIDVEEGEKYHDHSLRRGVAWTVGLTTGYYLFGFLLVSPIFVYLFMMVEGDHSRKEALGTAAFTIVFLVGLFEVLLETFLFEGVVVIGILEALGLW